MLQELSKDHKRIARFRTRMEAVDKWMSKRSLPKRLRERIAHYYQDVRSFPVPTACPAHQVTAGRLCCCLAGKSCEEGPYVNTANVVACGRPA